MLLGVATCLLVLALPVVLFFGVFAFYDPVNSAPPSFETRSLALGFRSYPMFLIVALVTAWTKRANGKRQPQYIMIALIPFVGILLANNWNASQQLTPPANIVVHKDSASSEPDKHRTSLMRAILNSTALDLLEKILARSKDELNAQDDDGNTALHLALNEEYIPALLQAGADPKIVNQHKETAPISWAKHGIVSTFKPGEIEKLVASGIQLNERDERGNTVLHYLMERRWRLAPNASKSDEWKIALALLRAGADPNVANLEGKKPVDFAIDETRANFVNSSWLEGKLKEAAH